MPVSAFVALFGRAIIATLLQRGAFDANASLAVERCLLALVLGFLASNVGNVVARSFYVTQRTVLLAVYTVFETALYVAVAFVLSRAFSYVGLAAATSVRDGVSVALYFAMASRMFGGLHGRAMLRDAGKLALATGAFVSVMLPARLFLSDAPALVAPIVGALVGVPVYAFLTVRVFRNEEADRLMKVFAAWLGPAGRYLAAIAGRNDPR